jgi:TetR/AcrR family transcriptional regulator, transcriptional repressor for nem operon
MKSVRKGELTYQRALAHAAETFSLYGYAGTTMRELRRATGLKGGVYGHFESKEALALEAFDYAVSQLQQRALDALVGKETAYQRLQTLVDVFRRLIDEPLLPGGCPILNTAVEADDAYPELRERAQRAMDTWHRRIHQIVVEGICSGQLLPDTDPIDVATILTASLEGAIMLSKLYGDASSMHRVVTFLTSYLKSLVSNEKSLS